MSGVHRLERQQWVAVPRDTVFDFFSQATNLEVLTPPWLRFEILSPLPIVMRSGTLIDYVIRLGGVPTAWRTRIEEWNPPYHFVDVQQQGPYGHWRHLHRFESVGDGTLLTDVVEYRLRFGPLGRFVHTVAVRSAIARIFDYRYDQITARFGVAGAPDRAAEQQHIA